MSAFVIAACRSPVAARGGALSKLEIHELAAPVVAAALRKAQLDPADVDEIIVSNALGAGGNPARIVALATGLPERVAGLSIDRQCAGGLDALALARQMILAGDAQVVIAGGAESYSRRPLRQRTFADGRAPQAYDQAKFTPWPDRDPDMARAADALAQKLGIDRVAQDHWAIESHRKALAMRFGPDEFVPLTGLETDSFSRVLTAAHCRRAPVVSGSITAANAAVAADAAAFCVVVSARIAGHFDGPASEIVAAATVGGAPDEPGLAPLAAIERVMRHTGITSRDLSCAEVMEAFAVQAIACVDGAGLDPEIVNCGGGALARGHPIGASGAINAVRLHHELARRGGTGLATIAAAGGIGTALLLRAR